MSIDVVDLRNFYAQRLGVVGAGLEAVEHARWRGRQEEEDRLRAHVGNNQVVKILHLAHAAQRAHDEFA